MKIKTYIALTLTLIFLAKFTAVDANGLHILLGSSDTVFVNLHCKKENANKKSDEPSLSQNDAMSLQIFTLNANCTTPFQSEIYSWEMNYSESIIVLNDHFTATLSYRYLESVSPPPRLA